MKFNTDPEFLKKRAEAYKIKKDNPTSSDGDFLFKTKLPYFAPKDGENIVRLLPAMWEDAIYPWIEAYIHYSIGANNSQFWCLAKMLNKPCPICEEAKAASDRGEKPEVVRTLYPSHRAIAWVIDRQDASKGPVTYNMPYKKVAYVILKRSFKRSSGEPVFVDDPTEGWDIIIVKTGKGIGTDYDVSKDEEPTPLHADPETAAKWLQAAESQNLQEQINYQSYEHIKAVLHGITEENSSSTHTQEVGDDIKAAMPDRSTLKDLTGHVNGSVVQNLTEELTMAKLKAMDLPQLTSLIEDRNLNVDVSAWNSDELPEVIGLELGLTS